jgi:acetyltransferase-like isoleucine patch superfamily enzyme
MPFESIVPGTKLDIESHPTGRVIINGSGVTLRIGKNCAISSTIFISPKACNTLIEIGDDCVLNGVIRVMRGDGGRIVIGAGTTFNAVGLSQHEAGEITFGRNNMLSTDIHADVSDMHPIYDQATGARINPAKSIHIADDVWIGTRVLILKGADIGTGAIIGAGSVVSGVVPPHVLAVGSPARAIRENVTWRREFDEPFTPPTIAEPGKARKFMFWKTQPGPAARVAAT